MIKPLNPAVSKGICPIKKGHNILGKKGRLLTYSNLWRLKRCNRVSLRDFDHRPDKKKKKLWGHQFSTTPTSLNQHNVGLSTMIPSLNHQFSTTPTLNQRVDPHCIIMLADQPVVSERTVPLLGWSHTAVPKWWSPWWICQPNHWLKISRSRIHDANQIYLGSNHPTWWSHDAIHGFTASLPQAEVAGPLRRCRRDWWANYAF